MTTFYSANARSFKVSEKFALLRLKIRRCFSILIRMASASQSASISRLQVGDIFVKTLDNSTIPPSYILISNGGGSTRWDTISSILPISSFKTLQASDGSRFSADLNNNTILISTTAIPSTFQSYIDPLTSSMMLSLKFPPITINNGAVPFITDTIVVPNPQVISSTSLQSTIRFYGLNDIYFSTVTASQAVYIGISSFTSAGYSTLNGEMTNNPKVTYSSFSTANGLLPSQSFTSSLGFFNQYSTLGYASTNQTIGGTDVFINSVQFDATHMVKYVNTASKLTTMSVEYYPNFQLPLMVNPGITWTDQPTPSLPSGQKLIKQVTSYLQMNAGINTYILPESSNIRYMNSQQVLQSTLYFSTGYIPAAATAGTFVPTSNYFSDSVRMTINPYTISSYVASNLPQSTTLQVWHIISSAVYSAPDTSTPTIGFVTPSLINNIFSQNGLFLRVSNIVTSPGQ